MILIKSVKSLLVCITLYIFFVYLYLNLYFKKFNPVYFRKMMYHINSDIVFLSQFNRSNIER